MFFSLQANLSTTSSHSINQLSHLRPSLIMQRILKAQCLLSNTITTFLNFPLITLKNYSNVTKNGRSHICSHKCLRLAALLCLENINQSSLLRIHHTDWGDSAGDHSAASRNDEPWMEALKMLFFFSFFTRDFLNTALTMCNGKKKQRQLKLIYTPIMKIAFMLI